MLDSIALNVVIGLVFIYLLYSLLVTTINEGIASLMNLRAKTLEKAIKRMLTDDGEKTNLIVDNFYQQPIVKFLGENNSKKPSYLSSVAFAKALIYLCKDLAKNGTTNEEQILAGIQEVQKISPETGKYLETIFNEAEGNIEKFQKSAEDWFNETMERATGWYKRQAQKITLIVALTVACSFNVDTIGIARNLSSNPKLAAHMADIADKYAKANKDNLLGKSDPVISKDTINHYFQKAQHEIDTDIKNANTILGLGWDLEKKYSGYDILQNIIGIILTAFAISLGAPFWFDLLNKLIQLRGSKKPEDSESGNNSTGTSLAQPTQITVNNNTNPEAIG